MLLLVAAAVDAATVKFVQPLNASQVLGPTLIEISTDAAKIDRVEFRVDGALAGVVRTPPFRMQHNFGTAMGPHEIAATVFSNGYRNEDTARITTAAMTASESMFVDVVEVPLRAHAAKPVRATDLSVKENGVPQSIREVQPTRGAARFAFIVDRSLSMGDGKLAAALKAIDNHIGMLRPGDTAEIVLFNHNVMKPRAFAIGEKVAALFGDVTASGGTSLRDALASIRSSDRTYAIVITDGGDRNSELSEEDALRRISNTRTAVDAITLGDRSRFLNEAARNTGGDVVTASAQSLDGALRDLIADINSRYLLIYQSHGTNRGWRKIDIGAKTRGVKIVSARKGYYAE
jgi:hypothetical protein